MLQGNYRVLNRSPGRFFGGSTLSDSRCNFNSPGSSRNFAIRDGVDAVSIPLAGIPNGAEPPYSWVIPFKGGSLSTTTRVSGSGAITSSNLAMGLACDAAITGSGDVSSASISLIVSMSASLAGLGDVSLASIQTFANCSASLGGSGGVSTATLVGIADFTAGLTGTGNVTTATVNGPSSMSASIVVTGDLLTTANVGDAVWQQVIEAGYSAAQLMQLISSINLGKSSGNVPGEASTVEFLSAGGSTVRVEGTLDANGNRTSVTLTPE